jgi:hypothetical protein
LTKAKFGSVESGDHGHKYMLEVLCYCRSVLEFSHHVAKVKSKNNKLRDVVVIVRRRRRRTAMMMTTKTLVTELEVVSMHSSSSMMSMMMMMRITTWIV